jgi:hypothetical protein
MYSAFDRVSRKQLIGTPDVECVVASRLEYASSTPDSLNARKSSGLGQSTTSGTRQDSDSGIKTITRL